VGNRLIASLGLAGALGFAVFSIGVPLTGVLLPMDLVRGLVPLAPVAGILIVSWTVGAGVMALVARPQAVSDS
jgi:hypothetical protein